MKDYPFLPSDAKRPSELADIEEQITIIRSALDAVEELAAKLTAKGFEVFTDNCYQTGNCDKDMGCYECYLHSWRGR